MKTFGKVIALICVIFLIQVFIGMYYASRDSFVSDIGVEQSYITESFGYDNSLEFHEKAERLCKSSAVTKVYMFFYELLNVGATGKIEDNFAQLHKATEKKLDTALKLVYLLFLRLIVFTHCLRWAIWSAIPILFSGYMWRQNRKVSFSYDSPEMLRWMAKLTGIAALGLVEMFFLPHPIKPIVSIVITLIISLLAGISVAYLPKRI